jgi:hypothetical protein
MTELPDGGTWVTHQCGITAKLASPASTFAAVVPYAEAYSSRTEVLWPAFDGFYPIGQHLGEGIGGGTSPELWI